MTSQLEISVLGPLRVVRDGELVTPRADKQRVTLAALAVQPGNSVAASRLVEELWADRPPPSAANTLQTYVRHLRRVLEPTRRPRSPSLLAYSDGGYALAVDRDRVDACCFEDAVTAARSRRARHPAAARAHLRAGLERWRGAPLADLPVGPILAQAIMRWEELRLAALEERLALDIELSDHAQGVGELLELVDANPTRERLWALLLIALYRAGRQADALAAYRRIHGLLADELGVLPGPELAHVHAAILRHRARLSGPPDLLAVRASAGRGG